MTRRFIVVGAVRIFETALFFVLFFGLIPFAYSQTPANGVTAHRGSSGDAPENTLRSFKLGMDRGADWIETDVRRTADGELVLIHDSTTGRTAGINLKVSDSSLAELQTLDAASKFRAARQFDEIRCPPEQVPTLEEAIDLIMAEKKARLSLQPKTDCVDEIVAVIREKNAEDWVGFNEGNLRLVSRAKELLPNVPIFWDRSQPVTPKEIATARERGFHALILHHTLVTPESIHMIRSAGLICGAWTVNDAAEMERLLRLGVERIYTDFPDRLHEVKKKLHVH